MPEQRRRQLHCAAAEAATSAAASRHPTAAAAAAPGCGKRNIINHSPPDSKITETNERMLLQRGEREMERKNEKEFYLFADNAYNEEKPKIYAETERGLRGR